MHCAEMPPARDLPRAKQPTGYEEEQCMSDLRLPTALFRNRDRAGPRHLLAAVLMAGSIFASGWAGASDLNALSDEERTALRQEIRDYLVENPELILEILMELQALAAQDENISDGQLVEEHSDEIFSDGHSWVGGNPEGDVTFVEFIDYRCGYCRRAYDDVETLIESDGNIRYVVKEFPILGPESERSARLAIAALQVGGGSAYKAAHDFLIAYNGPVSNRLIKDFAKEASLDQDALIETMDSDSVDGAISANYALADSLGVNGTPAFVIGGSIVRGWIKLDDMRQLVEVARGSAAQ